jgi:NOL1/NOP2/fmu family ribosome biogenesis protein
MGERLKSIHPSEISNLNNLWEAHKIRNRLVHEVGFILSLDESKRLIEIYHKTIEELLNVELELI